MPVLPFPRPQLADEVVLLRPWTADDVPAKVMGFAEPSVQEFIWPYARDYTEADARRYFVDQERARLSGKDLNFAFAKPSDPTVVLGGGSVYGIDREQGRAAVGYWLTADSRGRRDTVTFSLLPDDLGRA
ncbi:MAG TPA: GNAT family N-acetyltransferase [Solirubrobacteraceae bacterium]